MRRLVVSVLTSLDGYFEGPDRQLAGMPFEDAFNTHNLELLRRTGTMVYGGTWFRANLEHWSAVAADPAATERDLELARRVTATESVVVSDTAVTGPDDPFAAIARVVPRADAPAEIARLKAGDGGDLLVFGSATTWNPLLALGLVDVLIVLVGAALLGQGSPVYAGPRVGLHLLGARVLPGSGLVALRYDASAAA